MTASKYPFPTVCAESQSRDWFHSISRTLKWNERERQKSFVVVEEEPGKSRKRSVEGKVHDNATPTAKRHQDAVKKSEDEQDGELDEEDEVSEEEEEKYDIDDLSSTESPSSLSVVSMQLSPEEAKIGQEKLHDGDKAGMQAKAEDAARRLAKGDPYLSSTLTSHPSSGLKSGIDTPDRFAAGQHPHPPRVSPRHVQFLSSSASSSSSSVAASADEYLRGDRGERDDIHSPRSAHHSTRVRIPRDRDLDTDNVKTPTPVEQGGHRMPFARSRSRSREPPRRAFAVWGHDESDSAASDSDADA